MTNPLKSYSAIGYMTIISSLIVSYAMLSDLESNEVEKENDKICSFIVKNVSTPSLVLLDMNKYSLDSGFLDSFMERVDVKNFDLDFEMSYDPVKNVSMGTVPIELQTWTGWEKIKNEDVTLIPCARNSSKIPEPGILALISIGILAFLSKRLKSIF